MSDDTPHPVINIDEAPVEGSRDTPPWGGTYQVLSSFMQAKGRDLGVVLNRMPPGHVGAPFHHHMLEDEVFFVMAGTGMLRYGDRTFALRPGDCVSCPAGTGVAHQIAATGDEDLVYLGIGRTDPNEVCVYPDSGKVMVRSVKTVGFLNQASYMDGEPDTPAILAAKPPLEPAS